MSMARGSMKLPLVIFAFISTFPLVSAQPCSLGQVIWPPAPSGCATCSAGYYTTTTAATMCLMCAPGSYSFAGSSGCTQCPSATFNRYNAAGYCPLCNSGSFANAAQGATGCALCTTGQYSSSATATACRECSSGSMSISKGSTACDCKYPAGYAVNPLNPPCRYDSRMYGFGSNHKGQLGSSLPSIALTPTMIPGFSRVKFVATGAEHTLIVDEAGSVSCLGSNEYGQCGLNVTVGGIYNVGLSGIVSVAAGVAHSLFLDDQGKVWSVGGNTAGQLGYGQYVTIPAPGVIPPFSTVVTVVTGSCGNVTAIAAGFAHSVALCSDGRVFAWGLNSAFQLGLGDNLPRLSPTLVTGVDNISVFHKIGAGSFFTLLSVADTVTGTSVTYNIGRDDPLSPAFVKSFISLIPQDFFGAAGHTLFLVAPVAFAAGWNVAGRMCTEAPGGRNVFEALRLPPQASGIVAVAGSNYNSFVLDSVGTIYSCGMGSLSGLGIPDQNVTNATAVSSPVAFSNIFARYSSALAISKTPVCSPNFYGNPSTSCAPCNENAVSEMDSAFCTCTAGYQPSSTPGDVNVTCEPCPLGKFKASIGNSVCDTCAAPFSSAVPGASACVDCARGYIGGNAVCTACVVGKFSADIGGSACQECPAGTYSNSTGASSCTNCTIGTFSPAYSTSCTPCPGNSTTYGEGCNGCYCNAGFYSEDGILPATRCVPCDIGFYSNATGAVMCSPCDENSTTFGEGSKNCTCNAGYSGNGVVCSDIDECALQTHTCGTFASCNNIPGSYECPCNSGFPFNGTACANVNECQVGGNHNCNSTVAVCNDTIGSFTCHCNAGYTGNGVACVDVDECASVTPCHSLYSRCSNTGGSFRCSCNSGFTGDGLNCTNVNECASGTHNCTGNAICTDSVGGFACSCVPGFISDANGRQCAADLDECAASVHDCAVGGGDSDPSTCMNTFGSFTCSCKSGYTGNGTSCVDIDECVRGFHNCAPVANCANSIGSFACTCRSGYSGNGVSCVDVDECATSSHGCALNSICQNSAGSFSCKCNSGFVGNNTGVATVCLDIDECHTQAHYCASAATCTNTVGSFTCACNSGFSGNGETSCSDINECTNFGPICAENTECINNIGSFSCRCKAGYFENGVSPSCSACSKGQYKSVSGSVACAACPSNSFTETFGSTSAGDCMCNAGYFGSGFCQMCAIGSWKSSMGSAACTACTNHLSTAATGSTSIGQCIICATGYRGNPRIGEVCTNIDECTSTTLHNCDTISGRGFCEDTDGSFICKCVSPYILYSGVSCISPGPRPVSASLSPTLNSFVLQFDMDTDMSGLAVKERVLCHRLLSQSTLEQLAGLSELKETLECYFLDARRLFVPLGSGASATIGSLVGFGGQPLVDDGGSASLGRLKILGVNLNSNGACFGDVSISISESDRAAASPKVWLDSISEISLSCGSDGGGATTTTTDASLRLDATASQGGGPNQLIFAWSALPMGGAADVFVRMQQQKQLQGGNPVSGWIEIPQDVLMQHVAETESRDRNASLVINLSCSSSIGLTTIMAKSVSIYANGESRVSVSILGPVGVERTIIGGAEAVLESHVDLACFPAMLSSPRVSLLWTQMSGPLLSEAQLPTLSRTSAWVTLRNLKVGARYELQVTAMAFSGEAGTSRVLGAGSTSITINVEPSPVSVRILGDKVRSVNKGAAMTIRPNLMDTDGSGGEDWRCVWTCSGMSTCPSTSEDWTQVCSLSIPADTLEEVGQYVWMLVATKEPGSRSGSDTVTISVIDAKQGVFAVLEIVSAAAISTNDVLASNPITLSVTGATENSQPAKWTIESGVANPGEERTNLTIVSPRASILSGMMEGRTYKIRAAVGGASASLEIRTLAPPTGGGCSVTPSEGTTLVTTFLLQCSGWSVVESADLPLSYRWLFQQQGLDERNRSTQLLVRSNLPTRYTVLPVTTNGSSILGCVETARGSEKCVPMGLSTLVVRDLYSATSSSAGSSVVDTLNQTVARIVSEVRSGNIIAALPMLVSTLSSKKAVSLMNGPMQTSLTQAVIELSEGATEHALLPSLQSISKMLVISKDADTSALIASGLTVIEGIRASPVVNDGSIAAPALISTVSEFIGAAADRLLKDNTRTGSAIPALIEALERLVFEAIKNRDPAEPVISYSDSDISVEAQKITAQMPRTVVDLPVQFSVADEALSSSTSNEDHVLVAASISSEGAGSELSEDPGALIQPSGGIFSISVFDENGSHVRDGITVSTSVSMLSSEESFERLVYFDTFCQCWSRRGCFVDNSSPSSRLLGTCLHLSVFAKANVVRAIPPLPSPPSDGSPAFKNQKMVQMYPRLFVGITSGLCIVFVILLWWREKKEMAVFLADPVGYVAKNESAVAAPPSLSRRWRGIGIMWRKIIDRMRQDITLSKIFLARPWSTPSRSEAMLLTTVLVCCSMLSSALFYDVDGGMEPEVRFLQFVILSPILSSLPPQVFVFMLKAAERYDKVQSVRVRVRGREKKKGRRSSLFASSKMHQALSLREGVGSQKGEGTEALGEVILAKHQNLAIRIDSATEKGEDWPGKRLMGRMYPVVCAKKAARCIIQNRERRIPTKRALKLAGTVSLRLLGITPTVKTLSFHYDNQFHLHRNRLNHKARHIAYVLMVLLSAFACYITLYYVNVFSDAMALNWTKTTAMTLPVKLIMSSAKIILLILGLAMWTNARKARVITAAAASFSSDVFVAHRRGAAPQNNSAKFTDQIAHPTSVNAWDVRSEKTDLIEEHKQGLELEVKATAPPLSRSCSSRNSPNVKAVLGFDGMIFDEGGAAFFDEEIHGILSAVEPAHTASVAGGVKTEVAWC